MAKPAGLSYQGQRGGLSLSNRTQPVPGLGRPGRRGKEVSPPNGRRAAGPTSGSLPLPPSAPPPPARTKPSPRRGSQRTRPRAPRLRRLLCSPELQSRTRRAPSPCAPLSSPTPLPSTARAKADRAPRPRWRPPNWAARSLDATSGRGETGPSVGAPSYPVSKSVPHSREVLPRTCASWRGTAWAAGGSEARAHPRTRHRGLPAPPSRRGPALGRTCTPARGNGEDGRVCNRIKALC